MKSSVVRTRIKKRLYKGPATMHDLAEAAWGSEWRWPMSWERAIFVHIHAIRRDVGSAGYEIERSSIYVLKEGH